VIEAADSPAPEPKNCSSAAPKSPVESPCRYSRGSTSAICGDLRAQKPLPLTGIGVHTAVVDPRCGHRHRPSRGQDVPLAVATVAHHQAPAVIVNLINKLFHVRCNLGLQRRSQHLPSTIADDPIKQRSTCTSVVVGRLRIINYREHGRTFPNQRANAGS